MTTPYIFLQLTAISYNLQLHLQWNRTGPKLRKRNQREPLELGYAYSFVAQWGKVPPREDLMAWLWMLGRTTPCVSVTMTVLSICWYLECGSRDADRGDWFYISECKFSLFFFGWILDLLFHWSWVIINPIRNKIVLSH